MKIFGESNGEENFFPMAPEAQQRWILIHPSVRDKVEFLFPDKLRRIVLITIVVNFLKLSLRNICTLDNQTEQLEFLQELNNCLAHKSELITPIVARGGDNVELFLLKEW